MDGLTQIVEGETHVDEEDGGEGHDEVDWRELRQLDLLEAAQSVRDAPKVTSSETVFALVGLTAVSILRGKQDGISELTMR